MARQSEDHLVVGESRGVCCTTYTQAATGRSGTASYAASQFVAFPQVPADRSDQDARQLTDALQTFGFDVQATQRIAPGRSPRLNQARYYRADHAPLAIAIVKQLEARLCAEVRPARIGGGRLPNGVMEFWLGQGEAGKFAAPCPPR